MLWGETQSVIQLAAALNSIYLSLREIRNTRISMEQTLAAEQAMRCLQAFDTNSRPRAEIAKILGAVNDNRTRLQTTVARFEKWDFRAALASLGAIVGYIAALIYSSYHYTATIHPAVACVLFAAGFLPIAFGLGLNFWLVWRIRQDVVPAREEITQSLLQPVLQPTPPLQRPPPDSPHPGDVLVRLPE